MEIKGLDPGCAKCQQTEKVVKEAVVEAGVAADFEKDPRSMHTDSTPPNDRKMSSIFERFLSLWVILCIIAGLLLGKTAPGVARYLDSLSIYVKSAPVVSIPIAVCLF